LLGLGWAQLTAENSKLDEVKELVSAAVQVFDAQTTTSAREVTSMIQVRNLYAELGERGRGPDAVKLLMEIINAREDERSSEDEELTGVRLVH
jgi:hypothetical protein